MGVITDIRRGQWHVQFGSGLSYFFEELILGARIYRGVKVEYEVSTWGDARLVLIIR